MHYLITGHTGFKGAWLSLMLRHQGHSVSGVSLDPQQNSLFSQAKLFDIFENDIRLDIREKNHLVGAFKLIEPEVIIHLAAQPLVRESYRKPIETFETNVLGTLNVLEATRKLNSLRALLVVTTDKVYKDKNFQRGYLETDELGGADPYSASKAAADIASQSWITSFANVPMSIVRAGNVIGGGDWGQDRLIPDLVKAYSVGKVPKLRNPKAVRPWQNVLDCLNGYLTLVDFMLKEGISDQWNFGPDEGHNFTVSELVSDFAKAWGGVEVPFQLDESVSLPETQHLLLNATKSRLDLGWYELLAFDENIRWVVDWYKTSTFNVREKTVQQINEFYKLKTLSKSEGPP
jgi:CDP-glucose 4,6-dehydratase